MYIFVYESVSMHKKLMFWVKCRVITEILPIAKDGNVFLINVLNV